LRGTAGTAILVKSLVVGQPVYVSHCTEAQSLNISARQVAIAVSKVVNTL